MYSHPQFAAIGEEPVPSLQAAVLWGFLSPPGWTGAPEPVWDLLLTGRPAVDRRWRENRCRTCCWKTPQPLLSNLQGGSDRGAEERVSLRNKSILIQKLWKIPKMKKSPNLLSGCLRKKKTLKTSFQYDRRNNHMQLHQRFQNVDVSAGPHSQRHTCTQSD